MPTCDTAGVLGPVVSVIANFQVAEALKILTGNLEQLSPALLNIDLWTNTVSQLNVSSARDNIECKCCRQHDFEHLEGRAGSDAATLCGSDAVQLTNRRQNDAINLDEVARRLEQHGPVKVNEFMIRAQLGEAGQAYEMTLFANGRAIVKGTRDANVARSLYAKYIGH